MFKNRFVPPDICEEHESLGHASREYRKCLLWLGEKNDTWTYESSCANWEPQIFIAALSCWILCMRGWRDPLGALPCLWILWFIENQPGIILNDTSETAGSRWRTTVEANSSQIKQAEYYIYFLIGNIGKIQPSVSQIIFIIRAQYQCSASHLFSVIIFIQLYVW